MKNRFKLYTILALLLLTSGCGKKEVLTSNYFSALLDEKGYEISDYSDQYKSVDGLQKILVAKNKEDYQIEFCVLKDKAAAKSLYNKNVIKIQNLRLSAVSQESVQVEEYSKYILATTEKYYIVYQVGNTLMYIDSPIKNQEEIDEFIKEINYD